MTGVPRPRWHRFLAGLLFVAALLVVAWVFLTRRAFPQIQGVVRLPGLDGPVEIVRDALGIPHIYATTTHDLFFAQGYVHAQDRFWQMDVWRHIGSGRLAEMFGPSQVETDAFLRTLGWRQIAEQEYAALPPEDKAVLDAYAEGVNAYLRDRGGVDLGFEFVILGLLNPGYQPEPWTPIHTLTWAKAMAWDLRGNMDSEIERAILLGKFSPERVAELFPPYPYDRHPLIVPEWSATGGTSGAAAGLERATYIPLLQTVAQRFALLDGLLGFSATDIGSNSWVVAGSRTATGKPFLANDPHLAAQLPSIWYEIGLHCRPKTPQCPYDMAGFSFAGSPSIVIGHNDRIAWGFTNVGPDVMDLYIERINPDNPNQYEVNGKWVDMEVRTEVIRVAGGEPVTVTVRLTRHGPIISDTYGKLENFAEQAGIDLPAHYAIALRWTALEPTRTLRALLAFGRAQNWEEFRQAATLFDVPAQNLVYADVDGNIGYQMPGRIPIRKPGHDGTLPVPGWTDDYEWQGYIPFEELPFVFNPPKGYIVTANNAVVGPDYPYLLSTQWAYGYRAQRIVEMIERAPRPIDAEYIAWMQNDTLNLNAAFLVPLVTQLDYGEARLNRARDMLRRWDYRMDVDSAPAAVFAAFWRHLLNDAFEELPEKYRAIGGARWFEVVRRLSAEPDNPWWDDTTTPAVETRDDIFRRAMQEAVDELEERLGADPQGWAWGKLHTLTLQNQTLGKSGVAPIEALLNRGPYSVPGGSSVVLNTGWVATKGYAINWLPSMRMIVDLSDLSRSLAIHTTGQSGHPYHPHYVDMTDLWRTGRYHPMRWTEAQVYAAAEGVLRLVPMP